MASEGKPKVFAIVDHDESIRNALLGLPGLSARVRSVEEFESSREPENTGCLIVIPEPLIAGPSDICPASEELP